MASDLKIFDNLELHNATLVMGFSGWMNGGEVSTGTVEAFIDTLRTRIIAEIDTSSYYISNFPGSMEITSLFRPHCMINEGIIEEFDEPANVFWANPENNLVFFMGQEPNMNWKRYAETIFKFCEKFNISRIFFLGSVAGLVPHTREPRFSCTVSDSQMKHNMERLGLRFNNYNGPASISTYLISRAKRQNLLMASIICEIPAYVHGRNPSCIESMAKHISGMLGLGLDFKELKQLGQQLERKLTEVIEKRTELLEHIQKLEADYDNEIFDIDMSDLKDWLQKQGIRLD